MKHIILCKLSKEVRVDFILIVLLDSNILPLWDGINKLCIYLKYIPMYN